VNLVVVQWLGGLRLLLQGPQAVLELGPEVQHLAGGAPGDLGLAGARGLHSALLLLLLEELLLLLLLLLLLEELLLLLLLLEELLLLLLLLLLLATTITTTMTMMKTRYLKPFDVSRVDKLKSIQPSIDHILISCGRSE